MKNTPDRTERLLFVSRLLHDGGEAELKEAVERNFPAEAFERAGLVGFTSHVGGGYCVLEFGFEGPFEPIFENLAEDDVSQRFLRLLGRHVDPAPLIDPHRTARLPLAADQFLWRAGTGSEARRPGPRSARAAAGARKAGAGAGGSRTGAGDGGGNLGGTRSLKKVSAATGGGRVAERPRKPALAAASAGKRQAVASGRQASARAGAPKPKSKR